MDPSLVLFNDGRMDLSNKTITLNSLKNLTENGLGRARRLSSLVCVHVCACVHVPACVRMCVFVLYALNFDNVYL